MHKLGFTVLFILLFQLGLNGQIDSTWVNGNKSFEDGIYLAKKYNTSLILVIDAYDENIFRFVNPEKLISLNEVEEVKVLKYASGGSFLSLIYKESAHRKWGQITKNHIRQELALIVDNKLVQVSMVNAEVPNGVGAVNRNDLSKQQLEALKNLIQSRLK